MKTIDQTLDTPNPYRKGSRIEDLKKIVKVYYSIIIHPILTLPKEEDIIYEEYWRNRE